MQTLLRHFVDWTNCDSIELTFPGTGAPAFPVPYLSQFGRRDGGPSRIYHRASPMHCNNPHHCICTPLYYSCRWQECFCTKAGAALRSPEVLRHGRFRATSKFNRMVIRYYVYLCKRLLANRFFDDADSFYDVLSDCRAVFSGPVALHLLLPATDIDLHVTESGYRILRLVSTTRLFHWLRRRSTPQSVLLFRDQHSQCTVDIVASRTKTYSHSFSNSTVPR